MMNERRALYRQLQHYFERNLFGVYLWNRDVRHRDPEPVTIERDWRGRRINQRSFGSVVEKVIIEFDGYVLSLASPNEIEPPEPKRGEERGAPAPAIVLYDGNAVAENIVVQGANTSETWDKITRLLKDNMAQGQGHGDGNRTQGSSGGR